MNFTWMFLFFLEALTPLLLAAQKQFKFSHIVAPATAFGKVD